MGIVRATPNLRLDMLPPVGCSRSAQAWADMKASCMLRVPADDDSWTSTLLGSSSLKDGPEVSYI